MGAFQLILEELNEINSLMYSNRTLIKGVFMKNILMKKILCYML